MTLKYWQDPIGIYPLDHLTLRNSWSGYVARFLNPDPYSDPLQFIPVLRSGF